MLHAAPRVTVGIPVFNGEEWLAQTIQSVVDQSLDDFVVIVSDNASNDKSWDIAQEFAQRDERIECYRNASNLGVFRNMDRVFELAKTPYFKWCAVGDLMAKSFLQRAVDILENEREVTAVYSRIRFVGASAGLLNLTDMDVSLESQDPAHRYRTYLSAYGLNSPFHGLIRSQALARTSLNKEFKRSDQSLIAALLLQGRFVRLSEELLCRRIEPSTSTSVKTPQELDEFFGANAASVNELSIWKLEKQLLSDLVDAPIDSRTKFKIVGYLFRRLYWQRRSLFSEWGHYLRNSQ